jgi:hypothetical protein
VPEPPKPDRVFDLAARVRRDRVITFIVCIKSTRTVDRSFGY